MEVVAELTVDEIETRKRKRAEAEGEVIDLTALESDAEEHEAVARGDAMRAKRAAADAAAAQKKASAMHPRLLDAAMDGDVAAVRRLLHQGADATFAGADGSTALHLAAESGHYEVVLKLLAAGARATHADVDDCTPIHCAVDGIVSRGDGICFSLDALLASLSRDADARRAVVSGGDSALCDAVREGKCLRRGCSSRAAAAAWRSRRCAPCCVPRCSRRRTTASLLRAL